MTEKWKISDGPTNQPSNRSDDRSMRLGSQGMDSMNTKGSKKPWTPELKLVIGIGAVMCLLAIFAALSPPLDDPARRSSTEKKGLSDEQIKRLTTALPKTHIEQAKKTLLGKNALEADLEIDKDFLQGIDQKHPQYDEAQRLIRQIDDRLPEARKRAEIQKNPLIVTKSELNVGGFGTVAIWHVTLHNRGDRPVANVKYRTSYFAETGAQIDSGGGDHRILHRIIEPGQTRNFEINDGFINRETVGYSFAIVSCEYLP